MPAAWYPGMQGCHRLRGRKAGSALYLDVHIEVCPLQLFLSDLSWLTCAGTLLIKYLLLWFIEPYESFKFHHIKLYNNEVLMCILFMNTCWSSDMFYCGIISSSILNCFIFIVGRATDIFMHLPLVLLWHYRMSYPKFQYLKYLFLSFFMNKRTYNSRCEICALAKDQRTRFPKWVCRPTKRFSLIHSDLWGPCRIPKLCWISQPHLGGAM